MVLPWADTRGSMPWAHKRPTYTDGISGATHPLYSVQPEQPTILYKADPTGTLATASAGWVVARS